MTIEELIAALEKAESPSRELDAEIDATLRIGFDGLPLWAMTNFPNWRAKHRGTVEVVHDNGVGGLWWDSKPFTASIDAAVALVNRVLPDWRIENLSEWDAEILRERGPWMCDLVERGKDCLSGKSAKCAHAPTPAIALTITALKAKLHQEKKNADK